MNTITVKYWGRTGNILFQIAAAIYYSNKLNRPFILSECEGLPNIEKYTAKSLGIDENKYTASLCEYSETDISNRAFPENRNVMLTGFFQNYRICDEYKDYLFDVLGIHSIRENVIPKLAPIRRLFLHLEQSCVRIAENSSIETGNRDITISLHIRRGDYEKLQCYFILLNEYYYKNALMYILNRLCVTPNCGNNVNVVCFYERTSEQPAKQIIHSLETDADILRFPVKFYHFNSIIEEPVTDIEEMAIMSHCNHHITANSTYSWWAAYINTAADKIVCCPNEWYNHQLYYLSVEGFNAKGCVPIPAWDKNVKKCECIFSV